MAAIKENNAETLELQKSFLTSFASGWNLPERDFVLNATTNYENCIDVHVADKGQEY